MELRTPLFIPIREIQSRIACDMRHAMKRDSSKIQQASKCRSTACEKRRRRGRRKIMYKFIANGLRSADVCLMCESEHVSAKWVDAPGACMHTSSPRSQWPPNKFGTRDGRFMADSGPFLTHRQICACVLIVDAPCASILSTLFSLFPSLTLSFSFVENSLELVNRD